MGYFYLYRFLDKNGKIIYIGKTNDIRRRILKEHFTSNTHKPPACYLETEYVEYAEFANESEEVAYEAILINQIKPKYNEQFKDKGMFDINIPQITWKPFEWEFDGQMEALKAYKQKEISIRDALNVSITELASLENNGRPIFGFKDVDSSSILMPCTTAMIAAPSGECKTAYAIHIALTNARCGRRVLYMNLKDSADALVQRILFAESHIHDFDTCGGKLSDDHWERIKIEAVCISQLPITVCNHGSYENTIATLIDTIHSTDCDIVIIDELNAIEDFECSYDSDKTIRCMNKIKKVALERRIPIISLYCLNGREIQKRNNKRPIISDVGNSSLQSCNDIIQLLYLCPNEDEGGAHVEIITVKSNVTAGGATKVAVCSGKLVEIDKSQNDS